MNDKVMILALALFGGFLNASLQEELPAESEAIDTANSLNTNLQERLTAKSEAINVAKQNVKTGKPIVAKDRCIKCGNKDCKQAA
jgi:hypothetical protein